MMRLLHCSLSVVLLFMTQDTTAVSFRSKSKQNLSFDDWLQLQQKSYASTKEYALRQAIFHANQHLVQHHNAAYQQGWTQYAMTMSSPFADVSHEEFAASHLMEGQNCSATSHTSSGSIQEYLDQKGTNLASLFHSTNRYTGFHDGFVDWRNKGILTPIKSQGHCGSCWTFSTTGSLESHACLAHNKDCTHWKGLAEQQLVDCASHYNNHGCSGGLPSQAFEYIQHSKHGLLSEARYPYIANETGKCRVHKKKHADGVHVAEVFNITSQDEDDLVHAIRSIGPISIAYQVSPDFRFYSHGIYDSYNVTTNTTMCQSDSQSVNHAVVAVGLGHTEDTDKRVAHIISSAIRGG